MESRDPASCGRSAFSIVQTSQFRSRCSGARDTGLPDGGDRLAAPTHLRVATVLWSQFLGQSFDSAGLVAMLCIFGAELLIGRCPGPCLHMWLNQCRERFSTAVSTLSCRSWWHWQAHEEFDIEGLLDKKVEQVAVGKVCVDPHCRAPAQKPRPKLLFFFGPRWFVKTPSRGMSL